jgi:tRNA(Ile)-lysidine synthase
VLRELAAEPGRAYALHVAHLHHGLRQGADADAAFVAELAERWALPCTVERRDVPAERAAGGEGVEEAARRVRYGFLREVAERVGASAVATGHHADDNVETILFRLFRGTHLRGMAGIPVARALAGGPVRLVRPLLEVGRSELEAFCRERGLSWRRDPTNADTTGSRRNFIRHELLPLLRERLNPAVDEALLRAAQAAGEAEAVLAELAAATLSAAGIEAGPGRLVLRAIKLAAAPPAVRRAALRLALEQAGAPLQAVTRQHLAELAQVAVGAPAVMLPGGWRAERRGRRLVLERAAPP